MLHDNVSPTKDGGYSSHLNLNFLVIFLPWFFFIASRHSLGGIGQKRWQPSFWVAKRCLGTARLRVCVMADETQLQVMGPFPPLAPWWPVEDGCISNMIVSWKHLVDNFHWTMIVGERARICISICNYSVYIYILYVCDMHVKRTIPESWCSSPYSYAYIYIYIYKSEELTQPAKGSNEESDKQRDKKRPFKNTISLQFAIQPGHQETSLILKW